MMVRMTVMIIVYVSASSHSMAMRRLECRSSLIMNLLVSENE
jgi:hypothetical protein